MREGYAELGTVRLHYVEQGEARSSCSCTASRRSGRLAPPDRAAGRGRLPRRRARHARLQPATEPRGRAQYDVALLAQDVVDLIEERGETKAHVAGHDWGGAVAWATAGFHSEAVDRLVILNAPHPRVFIEHLKSPRQLARSWYMGFFQLPYLPELLGKRVFPQQLPEAERARYEEAYAQPGALTAMLNYYRALSRETQGRGAAHPHRPRPDTRHLG